MIDTTHPLIVLGEQQENPANDSNATFMTRAQDLTADANNIAGEACLYVYAQEQSGCYAVNAISGTDASIAAIGPGSQNAMIWDFVAGNPATGNYQQQSVAGVFLDARDGSAMKTVAHGTITPYNNPTASAVKYGLQFVGKTDITIESVHTENVQDGIFCEGDPNNASSYAGCWILSTDPSTTVTNSTVHLGTQVATAFVNTVTASQVGSPYALQDDTNAPA